MISAVGLKAFADFLESLLLSPVTSCFEGNLVNCHHFSEKVVWLQIQRLPNLEGTVKALGFGLLRQRFSFAWVTLVSLILFR